MSTSFNPYHKWLGIRPEEQPANHYRLLGIGIFETDPDVIDSAADQRTMHVRSFQTGPHSAESQKLLNEIAAARRCLLNPAERAIYDEKLRASQAPPVPAQPVPVAQPIPTPQTFPVAELPAAPLASRPRTARAKSGNPPIFLFAVGGAAVALLGLVVIVAWASRGGNDGNASATSQSHNRTSGDKRVMVTTGQDRKTPVSNPRPGARTKNDDPPKHVAKSTPSKPDPSDSKSPPPRGQAGESIYRIDFKDSAVLSDFVLAEVPGRKWLVNGGLLHIEGGFAHTTYGKHFKSIKSVTIRGGIEPPEGRNFRVSVGSLNMILNWEGANQNHYRLGETTTASVATEPHALTPGRIQEIIVRQEGTEVIVEINGQRQYSGAGVLEGTVTVYPAGHPIMVQEIVIEGEVDPARKVTGPSHKNLY